MSIEINYSKNVGDKSLANQVLFTNEKFNLNGLKKYFSNSEFSYISDLLKSSDLKKSLLIFELNSKKKLVLISIKNNLRISDMENLGGEFYGRIKQDKKSKYILISDTVIGKYNNFLSHFLHGLKLKSYEFKKYKTKKEKKNISINVIGTKNQPSKQIQLRFKG